ELPNEISATECALTIGTFDGVHRGHVALFARLRKEASQRGLSTATITFRDMPYYHFFPEQCSRLLTLPHEKRDAIASHQIDDLYLLPFDERLANLPAREFVRSILVEKLRVKLLVIGPDFALGKGRGGDVHALRAMGDEMGFEVIVLEEKLLEGGAAISSTRIRECVESGAVSEAAQLLGRPFDFEGEVVSGQQLGRTIGFPTINLQVHPRKVLPENGVYAVRALFGPDESTTEFPQALPAALNIGVRPTVSGVGLSVEFHVIDKTIDVTPHRVRLQMVERLRDEQKFEGLDALVTQLHHDIDNARAILQIKE
ncbi:MAG TPA: bifunctional riboflavin kinase/FAD synthetase, partial [Abditibacteriaceae bacterium]